MNNATKIRAYLRAELEALKAKKFIGPFSESEIDAELARRDEINDLRRDRLHYPELSHS